MGGARGGNTGKKVKHAGKDTHKPGYEASCEPF